VTLELRPEWGEEGWITKGGPEDEVVRRIRLDEVETKLDPLEWGNVWVDDPAFGNFRPFRHMGH
jgi:hypothetical protein